MQLFIEIYYLLLHMYVIDNETYLLPLVWFDYKPMINEESRQEKNVEILSWL